MLSPDRQLIEGILSAYREGWFPMADPDRAVIEWVQPYRRGVIPLEPGGLIIPRSLRQRIRAGRFEIRCDTAFERVIRACAQPRPGREKSWIDARILQAYTLLHRYGYAHSIEAWLPPPPPSKDPPILVGGLYGVHLGAAFFGESMYSRPEFGGTDSSKVCLVHLVHHLRRRGFALLDTQIWNQHLGRHGCIEVPVQQFKRQLTRATERRAPWAPFEPEKTPAEL